MPKIDIETHRLKIATMTALQHHRSPWQEAWLQLSEDFMPWRHSGLLRTVERREGLTANRLLDSVGVIAANTLAAGMMNGITSPSRPWFKLRLAGSLEQPPHAMRLWLEEVERRLSLVMAQSNFYTSLATLYQDLVVFGTGVVLIYEDADSVVRCYNPPLGEYYLDQSARLEVNVCAREFDQTVSQLVERFGINNVSQRTRDAYRRGGAALYDSCEVYHLIEPNTREGRGGEGRFTQVPAIFPYREFYWEKHETTGNVLSVRGFFEMPGLFVRWATTSNDVYGTSPAMTAHPAVIQLQHGALKKAQALDKHVDPPAVADMALQNRPTPLVARGVTFVSGLNNSQHAGIRPVYQVQPPLHDMTQDIIATRGEVRELMHNDLFRAITNLETVRSATEIAERKQEKLVLLGPVLGRFESEALDPAISRIYAVAERLGLMPDPPQGFENAQIEVQYESILTQAARVARTAPVERMMGLIGTLSQLWPKARNLVDFQRVLMDYGQSVGVPTSFFHDPEQVARLGREQDAAEQQQGQLIADQAASEQARNYGGVDVGGGINAFQLLAGIR